MSRTKANLSELTLNQLCTLTGKQYRAVKKILDEAGVESREEGGSLLYDPIEALPEIYRKHRYPIDESQSDAPVQGFLDPVREKARLDKARADKVELEVRKLKGEVLEVSKVEKSWAKLTGAFRSKVLGIPTKLAPRLASIADPRKVEEILKTECREALTELSQYDPRGNGEESIETDS